MVFTSREKAFCVLEYARTNSNKTVQHAFVRWFMSPSSCKCKRAQTKNHYRTEDSYPRHAASCLGGARLPTWRLPGDRRRAHWTFVKPFMKFTCL